MTTTNQDPEAIRREIDRTRGRLSEDVDVLAESVRPSSVAKRTVQRTTSRAGRLKESVMGSAHDVAGSGSDKAHSVAESAHSVADTAAGTAHSAADAARGRTQGNPLAAGAVALAAGWLVGSLLPASQKERQLAVQAKEQAQPLLQEASSVAKEATEHLKEPAQQAAQSVKQTAQEGVEHVKDDGTSAAQDVKETAKQAAPGTSGTSGSSGTSSTSGTPGY